MTEVQFIARLIAGWGLLSMLAFIQHNAIYKKWHSYEYGTDEYERWMKVEDCACNFLFMCVGGIPLFFIICMAILVGYGVIK